MKFKLDENLSRSVADLFRAARHDAVTVREQGLQSASDERVFEVAALEGRTLVTRLAPLPDRPLIAVAAKAPWTSPWRVLTIGSTRQASLESRIVKALAAKN